MKNLIRATTRAPCASSAPVIHLTKGDCLIGERYLKVSFAVRGVGRDAADMSAASGDAMRQSGHAFARKDRIFELFGDWRVVPELELNLGAYAGRVFPKSTGPLRRSLLA